MGTETCGYRRRWPFRPACPRPATWLILDQGRGVGTFCDRHARQLLRRLAREGRPRDAECVPLTPGR